MEKYYKVAESVLTEIAQAIRLQKKTDRKYLLDNMAKIIKAMLVLPSGLAESASGSVTANSGAAGIIPKVCYGTAGASDSVTANSAATSAIPEVCYGTASTNGSITASSSAAGTITE